MQSAGLLVLRVGVGLAMIYGHGWGKLMNFTDLYDRFPDPIGLGSGLSLGLVTFAEVFCAALLIVGLFSRVAVIPLIIDMAVAFFIVHGGQAFDQKEPSLLFLISFVTLLITGPGWYSLDNLRKRGKRKKKAALSSGATGAGSLTSAPIPEAYEIPSMPTSGSGSSGSSGSSAS
ncbi:MAG: DoxX family protein [Bacteroidetes bacterium]|nr:DoxX family protein [Bacteroidota bacterium]